MEDVQENALAACIMQLRSQHIAASQLKYPNKTEKVYAIFAIQISHSQAALTARHRLAKFVSWETFQVYWRLFCSSLTNLGEYQDQQ